MCWQLVEPLVLQKAWTSCEVQAHPQQHGSSIELVLRRPLLVDAATRQQLEGGREAQVAEAHAPEAR